MLMTALFKTAKEQKYPKCSSVGEWINHMWWNIHIMEYYSALEGSPDTRYYKDEL